MKQTIELEIPDGKKAEWMNGVLTLVDDKPKDVTERIKTFEDAIAELGSDHQLVIDYYALVGTISSKDILAYAKLRIIAAALNEGWRPKYEHEFRFAPNFEILYSQDKRTLKCFSINVTQNYFSVYGNALALKSEKLVEYAVEQFIDIYADYLL